MTAHKRLYQLRKHLNLNQSLFAERLGLNQGNLSSMESGRRDVGDLITERIFTRFNVNPEWWNTGEGEVLRNESIKIPVYQWPVLNKDIQHFETSMMFNDCSKFCIYTGKSIGQIKNRSTLSLKLSTLVRIQDDELFILVADGESLIGYLEGYDETNITIKNENSARVEIEQNSIDKVYKIVGMMVRLD